MSRNRNRALWTQGGQRKGIGGGGRCRVRAPTHTSAAPGSCSGRPGVGLVGSGSSADRPAWLSWGPVVRHALRQVPCEEGDEVLVTQAAMPTSHLPQLGLTASSLPTTLQNIGDFPSRHPSYLTDDTERYQEAPAWPHLKEKNPGLLSGGLLP